MAKQSAIENSFDLANIVSIQNGDITADAYLNTVGSKKQFVFAWEVDPIHNTAIEAKDYENILAGLKEILKGEKITFINTVSGNPSETIQKLQSRAKNASIESKTFIHGMIARIRELSARGERKERRYYAFSTYTFDEKTQDADGVTEKLLAIASTFFQKNVSKSDTLDAEEITLLLNRAFDAFTERQSLLQTKMGLSVRPLRKEELWEFIREKVNGESWAVPLPHSLSLKSQKLREHYYIQSKERIAVNSQRLHMASLLINPNAVPRADQNLYLPAKRQYVGIVRLAQLPGGFTDEIHALRWLWDEVASQESLIDFDLISQFTRGNEKDAMQAAQKYADQQESNQRISQTKGSRDRIAEYRSDEAGDVQLSLLKGDTPLNLGMAICIYVSVNPDIKDRKKAHTRAIELLRSKVNFVQNRFKLPAAAEREENYPWKVWLQALPLKIDPLYARPYDFRHSINATAAVAFTQLIGIKNASKYGTELISEVGSSPVNISLNDAFGSPRHLAFFGVSGSGKSTLVALFLINAITQGIPLTIMDYPKGKNPSTYTWLIRFYGGEEYDTGTTCNNLLEYIDLSQIDLKEHKTRLADFYKTVTNIVCSLVLDSEEDISHSKSTIRSLVELGVTKFYKNPEILDRASQARAAGLGSPEWDNWPTLADFYELFTEDNLVNEDFGSEIPKAIQYIRYRLYTWLNSDLGKAISTPSSFDGSSNISLFAVRNISSNQEAAILALSAQTAAMRKCFSNPRSYFYCDELSVLTRYPEAAYVVGAFLATGRANGLSVLLASQDPDCIKNCPEKVSAQIAQNISCKVIGKIANKGAIGSYQKVFGYDFDDLVQNASHEFAPSPSDIFSRWWVDDDGVHTQCRYYPPANILGIVANNRNEVAARDLFSQRYSDKFEALGRFSKWIFTRFRTHDGESEEIITQEDVELLREELFPKVQAIAS